MSYETLLVERDGAIATISVNRPKALNALNTQVFMDLAAAFAELADESSIRAIVLRGAGERAFVAGADIKEMVDMTPPQAEERSWRGMRLYDQIRRQPQPVIASVHGYALGGGMLLAMACDIRVAADTAEFGYPEIRLGIFPGTGGTVLIDRLIGPGTARAICLTGERFSAERAFQLGIVTHLVPAGNLARETGRLADLLAGYSPVALRELKNALNASMERDFESARAAEIAAYGRCFASDDRVEGMRAFIDKRPPAFTGR
jgi:enoyl-CoA hydratase